MGGKCPLSARGGRSEPAHSFKLGHNEREPIKKADWQQKWPSGSLCCRNKGIMRAGRSPVTGGNCRKLPDAERQIFGWRRVNRPTVGIEICEFDV